MVVDVAGSSETRLCYDDDISSTIKKAVVIQLCMLVVIMECSASSRVGCESWVCAIRQRMKEILFIFAEREKVADYFFKTGYLLLATELPNPRFSPLPLMFPIPDPPILLIIPFLRLGIQYSPLMTICMFQLTYQCFPLWCNCSCLFFFVLERMPTIPCEP